MACISKALIDSYIKIAQRPFIEARAEKIRQLKSDADISPLLEKYGITDSYRALLYHTKEILSHEREAKRLLSIINDALDSAYIGSLSCLDSVLKSEAEGTLINLDPYIEMIDQKLIEIKDAILLAATPEKISAFIKSIDTSCLETEDAA